jgi:predicted alpha/beta superfamily hydrolase
VTWRAPVAQDDEAYRQVCLNRTEVRPLHSTAVGEDYELQIALPPGYPDGEKTYPVLYLTDSSGFFGFVKALVSSQQHERSIPQMIVVGIAYRETGQTAWRNRARDHLPAQSDEIPGSGGAGRFLEFITGELFPYVDESFRTDPGDRIFAGMSSGGTLGAYVLAVAPDTFSRYLVVSPALHTGNEMVLDLEAEYAGAHDDLPVRLYTALGALEPDIMRGNWDVWVANLKAREYPGLRMTSEVIDGGTHMDAVYTAYARGLKALYAE